jgi:hypothetical protein
MKRAIILAIVILLTGLSHTAAAEEPKSLQARLADLGISTKVFKLKYIDPSRLTKLLKDQDIVNLSADDSLKVLVVRDIQLRMDAADAIVKALDVPTPPAKDIELTAYVLMSTEDSAKASDFPPELNDVVAQLKKVLRYKGFRLADTEFVKVRDGDGADLTGVADPTSTYRLRLGRLYLIPGAEIATIRVDTLDFGILPKHYSGSLEELTGQPHIRTSVDVPLDQKVVVGKTTLASPDTALVLVLTAKVVD